MKTEKYFVDGVAFANYGGGNFYWYRPRPGADSNLIFICDCGQYYKRYIYLNRSYYENGQVVRVDRIARFRIRRTSVPLNIRLIVRGITWV